MRFPGQELLELLGRASREIVIAAPFIKAAALERMLAVIPPGVAVLRCVTRWRPEEIAAGVSDLQVMDVVQSRPGARLFINPLLHAKFYRADNRCVIGSANVTHRALGWAMPANLELVVEATADTQRIKDFEQLLFRTSFEASKQLRDEMVAAASILREAGGYPKFLHEASPDENTAPIPSPEGWLPICPRPDRLYQIYSGRDIDRVIGWTIKAGERDMQLLRIPSGLSSLEFHKYVAASLGQTPLVQRIDEIAGKAISAEMGQHLIASTVDDQFRVYSAEDHWNTVKSWLLHFLPYVYRQPSGSSDLQKGTAIGEFPG